MPEKLKVHVMDVFVIGLNSVRAFSVCGEAAFADTLPMVAFTTTPKKSTCEKCLDILQRVEP